MDCVAAERNYLEERSQMGDPNAMYAMSLLYGCPCFSMLASVSACTTTHATKPFPRRIFNSPPTREVHSHHWLLVPFLLLSHVATRYQIGYHRVANLTKAFEIVLPVWRRLYHRNESLFNALYASSSVEVSTFPRFHLVASRRDFPQLRRWRLSGRSSRANEGGKIQSDETVRIFVKFERFIHVTR